MGLENRANRSAGGGFKRAWHTQRIKLQRKYENVCSPLPCSLSRSPPSSSSIPFFILDPLDLPSSSFFHAHSRHHRPSPSNSLLSSSTSPLPFAMIDLHHPSLPTSSFSSSYSFISSFSPAPPHHPLPILLPFFLLCLLLHSSLYTRCSFLFFPAPFSRSSFASSVTSSAYLIVSLSFSPSPLQHPSDLLLSTAPSGYIPACAAYSSPPHPHRASPRPFLFPSMAATTNKSPAKDHERRD